MQLTYRLYIVFATGLVVLPLSIFLFSRFFKRKHKNNKVSIRWIPTILISTTVTLVLCGILFFLLGTTKQRTEPAILAEGRPVEQSLQFNLPSIGKKISVATFNIYNGRCNHFADSSTILNKLKLDVVCTQEDNDVIKNIGKYKKVMSCGSGYEIVGIYSPTPKQISNINCIDTQPPLKGIPKRYAIVFDQHGITIANLHLEGGRFTDQHLFTYFNQLLDYKMDLLHKVVNSKPDIILGDFNSVFSTQETRISQFIQQQIEWYQSIYNKELTKDEKQLVMDWNMKPFQYLLHHGYVYATPSNEMTDITNGRGNSIIDCIFYNPQKLNMVSSQIIPIIDSQNNYNNNICISDHNPVKVDFIIT